MEPPIEHCAAQRELHQQWVRERIAYHEAKGREQEEARRTSG